jgi:tripartite-type tricarboxylate transporter receptor subunit TctC
MLRRVSVLVMGLAVTSAAWAQPYPAKPVTMIIPFAAGGPTDVLGRVMAQRMSEILGQQVVVENVGGAGGMTGAKRVADAPADGYNFVLGTVGTHAQGQTIYKKPLYNASTDFTPVALIAEVPIVLITRKDLPVSNLKEFVAYAKANPRKLSFASAGAGNQTQLVAELLKAKAGIEAIHVPYKSGAEMVTAVLGEQVQFTFPDISILIPLIREHKVKALAVTSARRHPQLPDVPTLMESGFPDFAITFWSGVVAPAGTPAAIVAKLNAAIDKGLRSREIQDKLAAIGSQTAPGAPQDFAAFIASEAIKWRAVAAMAGVSLD